MMLRSRRTVVRSLAALLVAPLLACSDSTAPLLTVDDVMFASSLNVNLAASTRAANGLAYQDLQVGTGAVAESGRTASVRYAGYLANGTRFDDNLAVGDALLPVPIGTAPGDRVVPGFEQGVTGMRIGGIRKIIIPPALAYGREGFGNVIPGNAVLVFDVELVSVQ